MTVAAGQAVSGSSQQVKSDAAGVATATIGPVPLGQTWRITRTSVTSSSVLRSTATIYRNAALAGNMIDATRRGGNADSSDTAYTLRAGESVVVQWTGADASTARCSFTIDGETI